MFANPDTDNTTSGYYSVVVVGNDTTGTADALRRIVHHTTGIVTIHVGDSLPTSNRLPDELQEAILDFQKIQANRLAQLEHAEHLRAQWRVSASYRPAPARLFSRPAWRDYHRRPRYIPRSSRRALAV